MKKLNLGYIFTYLLCITILIQLFFIIKRTYNNSIEKEVKKDKLLQNTLLLQDSVYSYIYSLRIDHPSIVFNQAMLESNKCSSKIFTENHNLFGMKVSSSRPTTAIGVKYGYATYNSWKESVIDYALYQSAFRRDLSEEEYYKKLSENYANDSEYIKKLKNVK